MDGESSFQRLTADIEENQRLREPQREAYAAISDHFGDPEKHREAGIVLPVGCGKSGLITLAPFAVGARDHSIAVSIPAGYTVTVHARS